MSAGKTIWSQCGYLTISQIARARRVNRATVWKWIHSRQLASVRDHWGRHWIARRQLDAFSPRPQGWPKGRRRKNLVKIA